MGPKKGTSDICGKNDSRFQQFLRFVRFDDTSTRQTRAANDKLAPIRDVWEMFVQDLRKSYIPSPDITVDEQLMPFRGRFIIYNLHAQ